MLWSRQTLTGQFPDKPTRSQSSQGLVNSWTSQLADSYVLKITENYTIFTLNLTLTYNCHNIMYAISCISFERLFACLLT